jgi:hypothetical protein
MTSFTIIYLRHQNVTKAQIKAYRSFTVYPEVREKHNNYFEFRQQSICKVYYRKNQELRREVHYHFKRNLYGSPPF